ncbi:macrophage mannose receptor 1-like [Clinocottus analis]|uniref:macrophage mannose receptor 1-like n=1 Tax=Clinocottus analis TaxID=304258 RepID=UPI0035C19014
MKTGSGARTMLPLSLLLVAARCADAFTIHMTARSPPESRTWTEARLYCQKNHIDLVTWDMVDKSEVAQALRSAGVGHAWIGLRRDPEVESAWRWINLTSGEGISGSDLSKRSDWANGEQSGHCAVVAQDLKWHSVKCVSKYNYYCKNDHQLIHYSKYEYTWGRAVWACIGYNLFKFRLATITAANTDDLTHVGWIGLYRNAGDSWKWVSGQTSDYRNWAPGQPINADCGSFDSGTEKWHSNVCTEEHRFVCYDDNMVVVTESKTWEGALSHCRSMESQCEDVANPCRYRYELLSLERPSDYSYVRGRLSEAETDEVWTGLRFLGGEWLWVDGQKLEDQGMLPDCPYPGKHCGTLSKNDTNNWIARDCTERRNFICYKEKFFLIV